MQLITEFAPYIAGVAALAGIGFALTHYRKRKRVKAELRYEVSDGPIRRSLALRNSYKDTNELVAELRRLADGLQDEIIQSKTGISSQQELNALGVLSATLIGALISGGEIEIPPAEIPWDNGIDPTPYTPATDTAWEPDPYLPYSPSPYIPREPSPWDDWDQSKRYVTIPKEDSDTRTEPDTTTETTDAQIEPTELSVEQFVADLRENLCRYHQQLGLGAVMLAYVEPDPEHDFEGGVLDVRYDLPSSAVQTHFTRIEKYLSEFGEFANERMASLQSGNIEDIERFKQFLNRACTEFHASLPLINAVVDFQRGAGIDDHIKSEFRIYKDLVTDKASARKAKQQLKNHRRLELADAALDVSEHLSDGLGCLLGVTSLFYGTLLTMRVQMANDIRAKKQAK